MNRLSIPDKTKEPQSRKTDRAANDGLPLLDASDRGGYDSGKRRNLHLDNKNTIAEAIAFKDGKILFVGSKAGAEAYKGSATKVVDLKGKVVMPGFVDAHVHAPGTALTELFDIYLYESLTKEQTLADVKAFIDANPDLNEYWGSGFSSESARIPKVPSRMAGLPSARIAFILTSNDGHNKWLKSKALEMNGIHKGHAESCRA